MTDLVVRRIGRLTTWAQPRLADAAIVVRDGRVEWVGPDRDLPAGLGDRPELDADGAAVLPGFVDCHTHAVWAGSRRDDVAARLDGGGYAAAGIGSTVAATRAASYDGAARTAPTARVRAMRASGTTTVEIKSGYGLTPGDEGRILDVVAEVADGPGSQRRLDLPGCARRARGASIMPSTSRRSSSTLPAARASGATWCDVFCESGAFSVEDARRILTAAAATGWARGSMLSS